MTNGDHPMSFDMASRKRQIRLMRYRTRVYYAQAAAPYLGNDPENIWTLPDVHVWQFTPDGWPIIPNIVTFPIDPSIQLFHEQQYAFTWHLFQVTGIRWRMDWDYRPQGFVLAVNPADISPENLDDSGLAETERGKWLLTEIFEGMIKDGWQRHPSR